MGVGGGGRVHHHQTFKGLNLIPRKPLYLDF